MMHYIRRHNYPVKQRIYGDEISDPTSLAEFAKDFPPGVMFKNVTPLLRGGNDDIKVNGMLKETEEAARASMLTYPETGNADKSHDDEDEKSGSQLMVEKLMQVFQNASLRDILKAVFYDENDRKHKELDDFFSSDADNSAMFDRDYVNRKLRIADGAQKTARLTNLARAIYRALSVHWTIQGMSSSMTPLDVATHIWFIVHHCKGQEHWMDGKLRDMKDPYVYGYPPKIDPDFRGHVLAKDVLTHFRTKSGVSRTEAKEDAETIQEVSAWSAADVLLPVRRGCMAQFVDGKYEDPSKERQKESRVGREYEDPSEEPRTESSVGRSLTYRDYTNAAPITDAYPGKAGRQGMDFRVPVRRTCETEKNAESGHVREVWTQDADIRVGAKIVKCKRKQASDYHDRDEVEVRLMGRDDWVEAVVVSAPALGAVHNPWIGVTVPGDPNVKYVTVNRVRDRTERRVLAAERARRAMDENENARKALVAKRAETGRARGRRRTKRGGGYGTRATPVATSSCCSSSEEGRTRWRCSGRPRGSSRA
eukprot:jgi/Mesvir1/4472/Mv01110-RA.1